MKRAKQMTRKDFNKFCGHYEKTQHWLRSEAATLHFQEQTNEIGSFLLIDNLENKYDRFCRKALTEFLTCSGGRHPDQPVPDEVKQDDRRRFKELVYYIQFQDAYAERLVIVVSHAEALKHQWSMCTKINWLAKQWQKSFKEAPIRHTNALHRYGFTDLAHAHLVGTKSAEMRLFARYKTALTHLAENEQDKVDLHQAKFQFLLEQSVNLPYVEVDGVRQLDTSAEGLAQWDEFVLQAGRALDAIAMSVKEAHYDLEGDAPVYTADGSHRGSLLETFAGGINPAEEFSAKEETRSLQDRLWQFRQSLSPQQCWYFDIMLRDPDLSAKHAAREMSKSVQDIYNLRDRIKEKWEKANEAS